MSKIHKDFFGSNLTYGLIEEYLQNNIKTQFHFLKLKEDEYSYIEGFIIPLNNYSIFVHLMDEEVKIMLIKLLDNNFYELIKDYGNFKLFNTHTINLVIDNILQIIKEVKDTEIDNRLSFFAV